MKIDVFKKNDLKFIPELQPSDWYDITPIMTYYTNNQFCFPLKLMQNEQIIGIGTAIIHHEIAWLGHIIVHSDYRNKGIGRFITKSLIDLAYSKNCLSIYLIATNLGEPVYKKLGFETETEYIFFKDVNFKSDKLSANIVPYSENFKKGLETLDTEVSGENRFFHLEKHVDNAYVYLSQQNIEGYYLPKFGDGLIVANTAVAGTELMKFRFSSSDNASFPVDNLMAKEFMHSNNFQEFKFAKRMYLGQKLNWKPSKIYNRIGGNLG